MSLAFGSYPTPLWRATSLEGLAHDVWIKDDGRTSSVYGGNKVRKLERLLHRAQAYGAERLLTIGAAGSHHVLATCLFGARIGLPTSAVLLPQPWTPHAEEVLRCGLKAGLTAVPCRSLLKAAHHLWRQKRPRDFLIGPGGMGLEGTTAYMAAAREVLAQARALGSRPFERIFVAAGSGSTAAGLLAGVVAENAPTTIVAVAVADNPALRLTIVAQALHALRKQGLPLDRRRIWRALSVEQGFVGKGYGQAIPEGERATEVARSFGLSLDPTYTAKAFSAVLQASTQTSWSRQGAKLGLCARETYLYWHTLSSAPLTDLIEGAPLALPSELAELLPGPHPADTVRGALG